MGIAQCCFERTEDWEENEFFEILTVKRNPTFSDNAFFPSLPVKILQEHSLASKMFSLCCNHEHV